ncbi:cytochrome P450 20A1-like [Watersipora subatra]|uniref:cytochrome P450 20A1-like n=1 Tax=Watersipora subatra TaxID=2589382 RepID=UPI00355C34A7
MLLEIILSTVFVVLAVFWYMSYNRDNTRDSVKQTSPIGQFPETTSVQNVISPKKIPEIHPKSLSEGNVPDITAAGSLTQFITALHKQLGAIAGFWLKETFIVSIASSELFGKVIHLFDRPAVLFADFLPLIGKGSIQYANGEAGQKRRKLHDRSFAQRKLDAQLPLFQEIGEELCDQWAKCAKSEEHIPLSLNCSAIVMKALTRFAFGDYFKNETALNNFRKDYDLVFWTLENVIVSGPLEPGSDKEKEYNEGLARMRKVVKGIIQQREEAEVEPEQKIFIDSLLDNYDNEDMLFSDVLSYLIGGSHTTGFFIFWMLYHLASNPKMQDKCYDEICQAYSGGPLSVDVIQKLKYLECVMSETHRFTNLAPFAARQSAVDMTVGGYLVPANTPVMISLYAMFKDEKQWPNANTFDPDRFLNADKLPPLGFEPFGMGKRKCPGYRMTNVETKVFLTLILKNFKISLVPGQTVGHKYGILTKPDVEVFVTVERRQ